MICQQSSVVINGSGPVRLERGGKSILLDFDRNARGEQVVTIGGTTITITVKCGRRRLIVRTAEATTVTKVT